MTIVATRAVGARFSSSRRGLTASALLALALGWGTTARAEAPACDVIEHVVEGKLRAALDAMDAAGALETAAREAKDAQSSCPNDERIAYFGLRAQELSTHEAAPADRDALHARLVDEVASAQMRYAKSARIAAIRARVLGTADAARAALMLDDKYAPAKVALAQALLASGDAAGAATALEGVPLDKVPGASVVQARALLQKGDSSAAAAAAHREHDVKRTDLVEPTSPAVLAEAERDADEVGGKAEVAAGHVPDATRLLLAAAVEGSTSAEATLRSGSPAMRKALGKLASTKTLPAPWRAKARQILAAK